MKKNLRIFSILAGLSLVFPPQAFAVASGTWTQNDWSNQAYLESSLVVSENGLSLPENATWAKSEWKFRQSISITNTESEQNNYAVKIVLPFLEGMNVDFSDLRFVDGNGAELSYWLQSFNEEQAIVWVKIPTLTNGVNTLAVYFGNSSAESASSGENTFLFFDDFSVGQIDANKWQQSPAGGHFSVSQEELVIGTNGGGSWNKILTAQQSFARSAVAMEWNYRWESDNASYDALMMGLKDSSALDASGYYKNLVYASYNDGAGDAETVTAKVYEDGANRSGVLTSWAQGTTYSMRIRVKANQGAVIEQSLDGTNWTSAYNSNYSAEGNLRPAFAWHSGIHHVDDIRVRAWLANEPVASLGGAEERFVASAQLISNIFDSGEFGSYWGEINFNTTLVNAVELRVRSASNADMSDASNFTDCAPINSGSDLSETACVLDGDRYLQYQLTLLSQEQQSPLFSSITIPFVSTQVVAAGGIDQVAVAGKSIPLSGANSEGQNLSYLWAIFSGVGSITNANSASPSYSAPANAAEQNVSIHMTVQDAFGNNSTDTVTVHIEQTVPAESVALDISGMLENTVMSENHVEQNGSKQIQLQLAEKAKLLLPLGAEDYSYDLGKNGTLALGFPQENSARGSVRVVQNFSELSTELDLNDLNADFDLFLGRDHDNRFGQYISVIDLAHDGHDDILLSSPQMGEFGALDFYNANLELVAVMLGDQSHAIGSVLHADVTGDASEDFILGPDNPRLAKNLSLMAASANAEKKDITQLLIYSGARNFNNVMNPSTAPANAKITSASSLQAFAIADFNGDGEQDIAVSNSAEVVGIFFGRFAEGTELNMEDAPSVILSQAISGFGTMLAAGDVNGDGFADVVISAPEADENKGAVYIVFGQAEFADTTDVENAGNVMKIGGNAGASLGQDLLLADVDQSGSQEIFTLGADNKTYMIDLSESVDLQVADETGNLEPIIENPDTGHIAIDQPANQAVAANSSGCSLNVQTQANSSVFMSFILLSGLLLKRRKTPYLLGA